MNEDIKTIAEHYGVEAQSIQLIEEMAELTQALTKLWRAKHGYFNELYEGYKKGASVEICCGEVLEEIADVEVCLEEIKYLLGIDKRELRDYKWEKIKRQLERIEYDNNKD